MFDNFEILPFLGPILNFPVIKVGVKLLHVELSHDTSPNVVAAAVSKCIHEALKKATIHLMEPIMNLTVSAKTCYLLTIKYIIL